MMDQQQQQQQETTEHVSSLSLQPQQQPQHHHHHHEEQPPPELQQHSSTTTSSTKTATVEQLLSLERRLEELQLHLHNKNNNITSSTTTTTSSDETTTTTTTTGGDDDSELQQPLINSINNNNESKDDYDIKMERRLISLVERRLAEDRLQRRRQPNTSNNNNTSATTLITESTEIDDLQQQQQQHHPLAVGSSNNGDDDDDPGKVDDDTNETATAAAHTTPVNIIPCAPPPPPTTTTAATTNTTTTESYDDDDLLQPHVLQNGSNNDNDPAGKDNKDDHIDDAVVAYHHNELSSSSPIPPPPPIPPSKPRQPRVSFSSKSDLFAFEEEPIEPMSMQQHSAQFIKVPTKLPQTAIEAMEIEASGEEGEEESDGIEIPLLPEDTFSFFAFSRLKSTSMIAAIFVISVQMTTLSIIALDMFSAGEPGNRLGVPIGVSSATSTIQILALLISVFSQTDYQDSLNTLYIGWKDQHWKQQLGVTVKYWRWHLSLWLRFFVSIVGLVMTFFLIISESDTTELLLDFTAIEFVTNLDNIFFWLCAWGYLGVEAQHDASKVALAKPNHLTEIVETKHLVDGTTSSCTRLDVKESPDLQKNNSSKNRRHSLSRHKSVRMVQSVMRHSRFPRFQTLVCLLVLIVIGWLIVFYRQRTGYYLCNAVYIEFQDEIAPELASFNGLYEHQRLIRRNGYLEVGHGGYQGTSGFYYCRNNRAWVFAHYKDLGSQSNNDDDLQDSVCTYYDAESGTIDPLSEDSYSLIGENNEDWSITDNTHRDVPLPQPIFKCFDCSHEDPDFCGGKEQGTCKENRCVCNDGWYGFRCEFSIPCDRIEYDPVYPKFQGNRKWAEGFDLLLDDDGQPVQNYGRPVYLSGDRIPDILFFNGARWAMASAAEFQLPANTNTNTTNMAKFFANEFHAFWSTYTVAFLSDPVSVDTPDDSNTPAGLSWYQAQVKTQNSGGVQGPDLNKPVEAKFLCATCSNETNPCLFGGICQDDGKCKCTEGSTGKLCHIPPISNGVCDQYFNTLEYDYDGGDCCKETCISTLEHTCGEGVIGESFGVEAFGFIGFPHCVQQQTFNEVHTIEKILKRGYLVCSSFRTSIKQLSQFYSNQCRAIAAAVFGPQPSFEMAYYENDRFNELNRGNYDVLFSSDYTASRDIWEHSSQSPFTFAALPSLHVGMVFGGIVPFASCADELDFSSERCQGLRICVKDGTTFQDVLKDLFAPEVIVTVETNDALVPALESGLCNVIAQYPHTLQHPVVAAEGFTGDSSVYEVTNKTWTKSFETWITTEKDREWSQFVKWVMEALVQAEESGITKSSSYQMAKTNVFGVEFQDMFRDAVNSVGNYGNLWDDMPFPRTGYNNINDGSSGLILSMDLGKVENEGPPPTSYGTIQRIIDRGFIRCGCLENDGFASINETTGEWEGLDVDLCKSIAAALFVGEPKIQIIKVTSAERFTALEGFAVDVTFSTTRTLERETKYPGTGGTAFDFSPIYFYDGLIFSGPLPHGKCASDLNFWESDCRDTMICAEQGTTWLDTLLGALDVPEANLVIVNSFQEAMEKHIAGECNALTGEIGWLKPSTLIKAGYPLDSTDYFIGSKTYTKEPLGAISRSDDPQFSDFVRWVIYGMFYAEEKGITKETYDDMPLSNLFGSDLSHLWKDSIYLSGNYGEIYERNLGGIVPREGYNLLNSQNGPQLYACPGTV